MPQLSSILQGDNAPITSSIMVIIGNINTNDILKADVILLLLHQYVKPNATHNTKQFIIILNGW
jgi:lipoate synthase